MCTVTTGNKKRKARDPQMATGCDGQSYPRPSPGQLMGSLHQKVKPETVTTPLLGTPTATPGR